MADAADDLGVDRAVIDVIDDVRGAVTFAIEATPPDGQVVVTGSLYVVSPARGVSACREGSRTSLTAP